MTSYAAKNAANGYHIGLDAADNPDGTATPIFSTVQKKWRTDFNLPQAFADRWEVFQTGTGMSYAVSDGTLTITTGTTLTDELAFLSRETFSCPLRAMVALNLSQRIVGPSVLFEIVSVGADGLPDGYAGMGWSVEGASATTAAYEVNTGGMPRMMSLLSTIPTTAVPTYTVLELEHFADEAWFHGRGMDTTNRRSNSYVRHQQIPDPNRLYKVRLRLRNRYMLGGITAVVSGTGGVIRITRAAHNLTTGDNVTVEGLAGVGLTQPWTGLVTVVDTNTFELQGTTFSGAFLNTGWATVARNVAPLSSTTVNFNFVSVTDFTELTAEITAGRGNNAAGQGIYTNTEIIGGSVTALGQTTDNSTTIPNPMMAGVKGYTANPTGVTSGRLMSLLGTTIGAAVVQPYSIPDSSWQWMSSTGGLTAAADTPAKAAAAAGIRNYVTGAQLQNIGPTATDFQIKDGATIIWRCHLPANSGMIDIQFPTPLRGTAATAINVQPVTSGASTIANLQGYFAP